jgi:putative transposase
MRTFVVRAYPTRAQHARLADYLAHTRHLYNAALEERIDCYRKTRRSIGNAEQARALTELRRDPEFARYPRRMQRWAVNLVDAAYRGMFTRHKRGERGRAIGFPTLRSGVFWNTIGWDAPIGFTMTKRGLVNRKSLGGTLRLRPDRPLPPWSDCKMLTLHRDGDRWFAHLTYTMRHVPAPTHPPHRPVGLDIGLRTLVMRSDGVPMDIPRQSDADTRAKRLAGRALARCKKRSKRRHRVRERLRRIEARIARRRRARLHVISARLTHHFDAVAVEHLNLRALNRSGGDGAQGRGIRRSWHDRAPGVLLAMLEWKCQRDGRRMERVDPRGTSIECSRCGAAVPKTLRDRMHRCMKCGVVLDRDHNAARNIVARAGWGPWGAKSGVRHAVSAAAGADLSLKHGGDAAGPRSDDEDRRPSSIDAVENTAAGSANCFNDLVEGVFPACAGMNR